VTKILSIVGVPAEIPLEHLLNTSPVPYRYCSLFGLNNHALWSCGHSSWLLIQRSRVRFPALPDFLRSSVSGTGSTQTREDN
jgi:hypothetical protein